MSPESVLEPERYELHNQTPAYHFDFSHLDVGRRDFFQVLGGGILILAVGDLSAQQRSGQRPGQQGGAQGESGGAGRGGRGGNAAPAELSAWLHIAEDGAITAYTGKVEIGQGIRTSLAQVVAEELHAPLQSVRMVMADTDLVPYDAGTFGSQTTPQMAPRLRRAAAAAREMLIDLAATKLAVDRSTLSAADGKVGNGKSSGIPFGQLTHGQKLVAQVSADVALTPATQWKVEGTPAPKVGAREIVTGKHTYTPDIRRPGMLYGKVLRPASYGATIVSLDTAAAEKLPGVTVVRDGDFTGVVAPSDFAAAKALAAIQAEWKPTPQISSKELFASLRPVAPAPVEGRIANTYTVAYIAHAPMEPRTAIAEWTPEANGDKLTVWTGTQRPFGVRSELMQAFRIPEDKVRVIVPDMGSGYGGKHTGEAAIEAARLAKSAGKPVHLMWTREEEFTWAYFRPAGVIDVSASIDGQGKITAWEMHNYNSGNSGIKSMYDIPGEKTQFHPVPYPLKQGSYRGLAATANHFAREVHMDELAAAAKLDPLEFRMKNIQDPRLRGVLTAAAEKFRWGKAPGASAPAAAAGAAGLRGSGISCGFEKGSYVATCAEVSVDRATGKVKILRVVTAFECGAILNPDQLQAQVEGSVVQAIGGTLFEAIEFADGKILNGRFSKYRVPRFSDLPVLETVLVNRTDLPPAGAGETPIVGLAPAVSNAVFQATKIRLRSLPLTSVKLES